MGQRQGFYVRTVETLGCSECGKPWGQRTDCAECGGYGASDFAKEIPCEKCLGTGRVLTRMRGCRCDDA